MVPVSQEHADFAALCSGSGNEPVHEIRAVLIVHQTVALGTKVYVGEYRGFAEEIQCVCL